MELVMPGLVPSIHVLASTRRENVDGRIKPGHDEAVGQAQRMLEPHVDNFVLDLSITYRLLIKSIADGLWIPMTSDHEILFRTLADPTRRAIFERLCREGEQTVAALTAQAGVSQPAVSKHLGVLKQAGLVRDRHEGRQTHYTPQLGALAPLIDWTSQMAGFWQSRFDHLEDLLKRMDQ